MGFNFQVPRTLSPSRGVAFSVHFWHLFGLGTSPYATEGQEALTAMQSDFHLSPYLIKFLEVLVE